MTTTASVYETTDAIIEIGMAAMEDGMTAPEAAEELLQTGEFGDRLQYKLLRRGIITLLDQQAGQNRAKFRRDTRAKNAGELTTRSDLPDKVRTQGVQRSPSKTDFMSLTFEVGGTIKAVKWLTEQDLEELRLGYERARIGAERGERWARTAKQMLGEMGCDTIAELPSNVTEHLAWLFAGGDDDEDHE